nr:pectin lyase-like superfamily protein [Tanacetum cinerariifolium]
DLELGHGTGITIKLDLHKGLLDAVSDWLPNDEHRKTKPIITMLEDIRLYIMQRLVEMKTKAMNLEDRITPSIIKRLEILKEQQSHSNLFLGARGIPCVHHVAAYLFLNKKPGKGVDHEVVVEVLEEAKVRKVVAWVIRGRAIGRGGRSGRARGRGGRGQGRGGKGRGRGVSTMLVDEKEEIRKNMKHEYMEQILIKEEEKRITAEKEIQEEFDEEVKQGRKRKVAEPRAAEPPLRIYHKNIGRSERIFNPKMKKTGFGLYGEGSTADKAFLL